MKTYVCRLTPNQDLLLEINQVVRDKQISAGVILTCVGSLNRARLRLAGEAEVVERDGPFEITSLVGTLSADGAHLHMALFDGKGTGWGGHLVSGNLIHTTAEIVIADLEDYRFKRKPDVATGFRELTIETKGN